MLRRYRRRGQRVVRNIGRVKKRQQRRGRIAWSTRRCGHVIRLGVDRTAGWILLRLAVRSYLTVVLTVVATVTYALPRSATLMNSVT